MAASAVLALASPHARTAPDAGAATACKPALTEAINAYSAFLTVQNRLSGEQLEELIRLAGGSYFFALPGVRQPGGYLGRNQLATV